MKLFNKANWRPRAVLYGLLRGYSIWIFSEAVGCWVDAEPDWSWRAVLVKWTVWTVAGLTFGRWAALRNRRVKQSKSKRNDTI